MMKDDELEMKAARVQIRPCDLSVYSPGKYFLRVRKRKSSVEVKKAKLSRQIKPTTSTSNEKRRGDSNSLNIATVLGFPSGRWVPSETLTERGLSTLRFWIERAGSSSIAEDVGLSCFSLLREVVVPVFPRQWMLRISRCQRYPLLGWSQLEKSLCEHSCLRTNVPKKAPRSKTIDDAYSKYAGYQIITNTYIIYEGIISYQLITQHSNYETLLCQLAITFVVSFENCGF